MEELVAGWIWRPLYQCVNLSWWYSHLKMRNGEEAGGSAASVTHPVCVCAFLSASLSFSFYFHPTFHPHAWCPLPECQGSVYVHTKRTGKGGLWGHTHPSMQTHPNLSLSFFFFFFLESVRVHFCFSETANPEETVVPHTDGSIRIERMKEEEDEGSLLSLSATLTLLLDTVTLP